MVRAATSSSIVATVLLAAASAAAQGRAIERLSVGAELGVGAMVSSYQRNDDVQAWSGSAPGYRDVAGSASLRLAWRVVDALHVEAAVSAAAFPSSTGAPTGWVFAPTLGLSVRPLLGARMSLRLDAHAGLAMTGHDRAPLLDAGLGLDVVLTRALSLGPFARYTQVIQGETRDDGAPEPFPDDARYVMSGLALTWSPPPRAPVVAPEPAPPEAPARDHDGDGVPDRDDMCPTVAMGAHPSPTRRGCVDTDADGDGVYDGEDLCPAESAGSQRDPMRPGCPDGDRDRDAIADHADRCPDEPVGAQPDPDRAGCPDGDGDRDGVSDHRDRCPDRPETFNNVDDGDGCPDAPALVTLSEGAITLLGTINFAPGSNHIVGGRSFDTLDSLVALLAAHRELLRVEVQGHTDDRGSAATNLALSQRRADAVRLYLVEHGIASARLVARGYGSTRPIARNDSATHRALNRRVALAVLDTRNDAAR